MLYLKKFKLLFAQRSFIILTVLLVFFVLFLSFGESKPFYKTTQTPTPQITSKPSLIVISPEVIKNIEIFQNEFSNQLPIAEPPDLLTDVNTQVYDIRTEEEYRIGRIRNSSLLNINNLIYLAQDGRFKNKIILIVTSGPETEDLKAIVSQIKENGANAVYLLINFDPDDYPQEIIDRVPIGM